MGIPDTSTTHRLSRVRTRQRPLMTRVPSGFRTAGKRSSPGELAIPGDTTRRPKKRTGLGSPPSRLRSRKMHGNPLKGRMPSQEFSRPRAHRDVIDHGKRICIAIRLDSIYPSRLWIALGIPIGPFHKSGQVWVPPPSHLRSRKMPDNCARAAIPCQEFWTRIAANGVRWRGPICAPA
jgi:hypothetical protein